MNIPNWYIICGTVLITIGGLVATHGWNARSDMLRKASILKAASAEYLTYEAIILDSKFVETNEELLSQFTVFPRFHTIALESAISSGLFLDKNDREVFTRAVNLHELLHEFNKRLTITEDTIKNDKTSILKFRIRLRDGATRNSIISKLTQYGALLETKYGINFKEEYFVTLEEDAT